MTNHRNRFSASIAAAGIGIIALTGCTITSQDSDSVVTEFETTQEAEGTSTFIDNTYKSNLVEIRITDTRVIQPGEPGNTQGDSAILGIWYEATAVGDEGITPITSWLTHMRVVQDTGADVVNDLQLGMSPDEALSNKQSEIVQKGDTVANAVAYILSDSTAPVELIAQNLVSEVVGSTVIPL